MKKFVFASVMALASISLVSAPTLRAQDSDQITIKDPAEFNAYQMATTQSDPKAKAAALEGFLQAYPQSVVKAAVLDLLVDTYQQLNDPDHTLSAATRLLQVDPNNTKAIYISVLLKKAQCQKTSDAQTCDDAAAMAQKGLATPKPAKISAADWKKQTDATYPIFHSAIALDDILSKKDVKAGIAEYTQELMLFTPEDTQKGTGLVDTLNIAEAYVKETPPDAVNAVWFYARALNFAPDSYKAVIGKKLEYWYKKYHGGLDGLDDLKVQAAKTVFPSNFVLKPAPTPAEKIHTILVNTPDLRTLALADKELVLAFGAKEDADKLWALMKDQSTLVPGIVIEATDSVIKLAVTADAKEAKLPDFIVNLKAPLTEKEKAVYVAGFAFGDRAKGEAELDGTYDTYTQVPATATTAQSVQIVLREGTIVPAKKVVPVHKPTPAHRPAAH
ncbi:MAG: hypothetical protein ABSD43_00090 [Terracidiphilus sp.]|jgi:hypothetical protein